MNIYLRGKIMSMTVVVAMLQEYIVPIVFVICYLVGNIIRTSLDKIDNKHIPLILGILGIVISVWVYAQLTPVVVAVGLASAWAATGFYELTKNYEIGDFIKNLFKKD